MASTTGPLLGGQPFYGFDIGIILLQNDAPRPLGDVGNAGTWDFPVLYAVADEAVPERVVERSAEGLLPSFTRAARWLETNGVRAISTSCGFIALYQRELAAAVSVPTATSSLLQVPSALRTLRPDQRVCVLTINARTLTSSHLVGAGLQDDEIERLRIVGLEESQHLYPAIIQGRRELDVDAARAEMVAAACQAVEEHPDIGAFVFECTNMPPYASAVQQATGRPVWDAVTLIESLRSGVRRQSWPTS